MASSRSSLLNILFITGVAAAATTVAVIAAARGEQRPPAEPINAISHIVFDDEAIGQPEPSMKYTGTGLLLNLSAMLSWALVAELGFRALQARRGSFGRNLLVGAATSALAYVTDFKLVPKRLTPGFEHVLSFHSLKNIYSILAVSIAAAGSMREA